MTDQAVMEPSADRTDLQRLLKLRVPVIVAVARRTMKVAEIVGLGLGAVIEFDRSAESELELLVNNARIGSGVAVKVGENFGLQLTGTIDPRETIRTLGLELTASAAAEQAGDASEQPVAGDTAPVPQQDPPAEALPEQES